MKITAAISVITAILLAAAGCGHCDDNLSYRETIGLIKETMARSTSVFRNESYGEIRFNACKLSYNVTGVFPSGGLYDMKFSDIDFSSLNANGSKTGSDYTPYLVLMFDKPFGYKEGSTDIGITALVVNVSGKNEARSLYRSFLHLGELCRAASGH